MNRILKAQIKGRLLLSKEEKATLAEIAHRLRRRLWGRRPQLNLSVANYYNHAAWLEWKGRIDFADFTWTVLLAMT